MTTPDADFLADVEALAEFVAVLAIDADLRGRVERIRCDVHDLRRGLEARERKRRLRDAVRHQAYSEAR